MNKVIFQILTFLLPFFVFAKASYKTLEAARFRETAASYIDNQKIDIDGKLDESIWKSGVWQGDFFQRNPNDGTRETYPTEFCVLYDDEFLYVGARANDPEPDKIIAILSRRDDYSESDWLYVSIDSYDDNRTAFEFGLNAAGVKHDIRRYDDNNMDENWDAIWDGNASIDEKGWTAEWRIPFRELRFTTEKNMQWGLQVYRELPRHDNELSVWSYWSQSEEGFVSHYGSLTGLKDIHAQRPIYFSPYFASQANISDNLITSIRKNNYDLLFNLGGDFRYSSPFGITLNATINPDFGQVEADPADYNLTEFETYFPEKRPFFMEGANILRFSLGFGDGDMSSNSLFYSRRIGRAPQGDTEYDDSKEDISVDRPDVTNILGAAKITGKTPGGLSIGFMEAVTTEEKAIVHYDDHSKDENVVEPFTNYMLSRFQQDFNDGQASIGGIFTAVNRKFDGTGIDYIHDAAYTGGLDLDYEFLERKYGFQGSIAFSHVTGDTTAIQETQLSSARYFQRPDADHLEYDPTATSLSGYAIKGIFTKNTGHLRAATGGLASSPGFEINDLGYLRNVDNINQFVWVQYYEWEPGKLFRQYRLNFNQWAGWDFSGMQKYSGGNINMHFTFHNSWNWGYGINRNFGGLAPSMNRGGPALYTPKAINFWTYMNTDQRKDVIFNLFGYYFRNDDDVFSYGFEPGLTWRPRHNLQLTTQVEYNQLDDTWAWIGDAQDKNDETQYIWSGLKQKTLSITFRTDLTLTTNLSLQYYAQPYFTAGDYFDYLELADSRNSDFDKRFTQLGDQIRYDADSESYFVDKGNDGVTDYEFEGNADFNFKQFRSNLVLRWEYSTGSVVYLVWSQGFTNFESFEPFNIRKDVKTLFRDVGTNVVMIKISHNMNL